MSRSLNFTLLVFVLAQIVYPSRCKRIDFLIEKLWPKISPTNLHTCDILMLSNQSVSIINTTLPKIITIGKNEPYLNRIGRHSSCLIVFQNQLSKTLTDTNILMKKVKSLAVIETGVDESIFQRQCQKFDWQTFKPSIFVNSNSGKVKTNLQIVYISKML